MRKNTQKNLNLPLILAGLLVLAVIIYVGYRYG